MWFSTNSQKLIHTNSINAVCYIDGVLHFEPYLCVWVDSLSCGIFSNLLQCCLTHFAIIF